MSRLRKVYLGARRVWWPWVSVPCLAIAFGVGISKASVPWTIAAIVVPPVLSWVFYRRVGRQRRRLR